MFICVDLCRVRNNKLFILMVRDLKKIENHGTLAGITHSGQNGVTCKRVNLLYMNLSFVYELLIPGS